ncbi:MAG: cytochrome P450 [Rhodobacterales bacterium]|nr:MAG: cytochrome P450 [Rhodobacterales bacterium]
MQKFTQSPTNPDFVQNPYPFYDRARATGDLFHWTDYGMACAVSHRAVHALLRDKRLGRAVPPEFARPVLPHLAPFEAIEQHSMLELEPPRHTRLRGLVLRAFTSRRIAALGPDIRNLAQELIDAFPKARPFDLLPAFCAPLPVRIIARLLGVPEDMAPQLLTWSNRMVAMYQASRTPEIETRAAAAAQDFADFMRGYIDQRRSRPADDLITHLIAAEEQGEKLSTDEMITTCILLLNAGHEATVHSLGNGVKCLLEHGMGRASLNPDTVEELLRFDPPLHMFTRYVYENVTLFGHDFRRGDQIGLLLAAANRDPARWSDPNRFDPTRTRHTQHGFGGGLHFCVGAPLARLELDIALTTLFERCPNLRLTNSPRYANAYHFHGLERLEVTT